DPQQRGLAAAARPHQSDELAFGQLEVDVLRHRHRAERLPDVLEPDRPGRPPQPFTAPAPNPATRWRCISMKRIAIGTVISTAAAIISPQSTCVPSKKCITPTVSGRFSIELMNTRAKRKSFHETISEKIAAAMMPGAAEGSTMSMKTRSRLAPSII